MSSPSSSALCWFRRDLRLHDHAALHEALWDHPIVHCAFVFDTDILVPLPNRADRRVEFLWHAVRDLHEALERRGSTLRVLHGSARQEVPRLAARLGVQAVYWNRDDEPDALSRDREVAAALRAQGIRSREFPDQGIFDRDQVVNRQGTPYSVFSAYRKAWMARLTDRAIEEHPVEPLLGHLAPSDPSPMPSLADLGFRPTDLAWPSGLSGARRLLQDFLPRVGEYHRTRDLPAQNGTSRLSPHLRIGTLSIREVVRLIRPLSGPGPETFLSELCWRDFFHMILWFHPQVVHRSFQPAFEAISWRNDPDHFHAWCEGRTGYPLVDAAMRQLNQTGWMHNRLRMITASFLVKDLLVDWRLGERYFATLLLDYDLAVNNGNWQWAASTGCDPQPWFRVFHPVRQSRRFDPDGAFIRRFVPELAACPASRIHEPWTLSPAEQHHSAVVLGRDYPFPIVDHDTARREALQRFRAAARAARGGS